MQHISSKENIKIKDLIRLRDDNKFREEKSLYYIEGERIINDTSVDLINSVFVSEDLIDKYKNILSNYDEKIIYSVSNDVFDKIKTTKNSQGIIATVKYNLINELNRDILNNNDFILILDNINDPGNLGTIIRMAEATNVSLIIISSDSCDPYNFKSVKASMSSISRKKIFISNNLLKDITFLKENGYTIYASILEKDSIPYNKITYNKKTAVIIGNEANGIKNDICNISDYKIKIPMAGKIESLNASIAASIICYEIYNKIDYYENK